MLQFVTTLVEKNQDEEIARVKIFPFSLRDQAKEWFMALKPWIIYSWDDLTKEFYRKFFLMSRTTALKRAIQLIEGKLNEPFHRVWEVFKDYVYVIPHHGFAKRQSISYFYEGITPKQLQVLKRMCNGQFFDRGPEEAWDYFNELTGNNQTWELADSNRPRASRSTFLNEGSDKDLRVKLTWIT